MFRQKAIDPALVSRTGAYRIDKGATEELKAVYRPYYKHLNVVTRMAEQTGGLVMPKFALPNWPDFAPQFNPDKDVVINPVTKLHRHDRKLPEGRKVLALVERSSEVNWIDDQLDMHEDIKLVPKRHVRKGDRVLGFEYSQELLAGHVDRCRSKVPYNPEAGEGDHHGRNVLGWHRHAPRKAKYLNFGDNKYVDCGPGGLDEIVEAFRAGLLRPGMLLGLEGWLKYLSGLSNGWYGVSVASVTLWDERQMRWLAQWVRKTLPGVTVYVNPDADWAEFERNRGAVFRQAMYVQTTLRDELVDASIVTPPPPTPRLHECKCKPGHVGEDGRCENCGGYFKAFDDWYGAGGTTERLEVLTRTEPRVPIFSFVLSLQVPHQRRKRLYRALRGLSLHDRDGCGLLDVPLKTLQRITGARRPQDVPEILLDLGAALDIDGPLKIEKREHFDLDRNRWGFVWDWEKRPTLCVRSEFRAHESCAEVGGNNGSVSHETSVMRA